MHRYLVRVDPRVHPDERNQQILGSMADLRRLQELLAKLDDATEAAMRARNAKASRAAAAISRVIQ